MKAIDGRKWWASSSGLGGSDGDDFSRNSSVEGANKLYVGMLIMLIFSEALALYGLIVALILSQHSYSCSSSA
jgi:V-type H+-transporting ATPase proteolipid subunit